MTTETHVTISDIEDCLSENDYNIDSQEMKDYIEVVSDDSDLSVEVRNTNNKIAPPLKRTKSVTTEETKVISERSKRRKTIKKTLDDDDDDESVNILSKSSPLPTPTISQNISQNAK
jgi:hypothetical protein